MQGEGANLRVAPSSCSKVVWRAPGKLIPMSSPESDTSGAAGHTASPEIR